MKSYSKLYSNERSEGGELITEMNMLFSKYDWGMKRAVGELSLKTKNPKDKRNSTLFPDVVIFADEAKLQPLMGWELKMPDVKIEDEEFIANARDKAERLGTTVFVLWNFSHVAIYFKENEKWSNIPSKIFNEYSYILTDRKSVQEKQELWKKQLEDVMNYLNMEQNSEKFSTIPIEFSISNYVEDITFLLTPIIANHYKSLNNTRFKQFITYWVENEKAEWDKISGKIEFDDSAIAFAKNVIMKWINRILFAHLIKHKYNIINSLLVEFSQNKDITKLSNKFNVAVNTTDFYTILHVEEYEKELPIGVVENLNEFNIYLANSDFSKASTEFTSKILENIVETSKRELMGLYTTPKGLAKLLVNLTIEKSDKVYADLTVGSGTIVRTIMDYISKEKTVEYAHNNVWAVDKYNYPLQIANLAMTTPDSINLKNIIFQEDALNLLVGNRVEIVNPMTGERESLDVPKFDYIISNLPFVSSNNRNSEFYEEISQIIKKYGIDNKSDLYQILLLKFKDLIADKDSKIGVITSNSWFKIQKDYKNFFKVLSEIYNIEYVISSNEGRWFSNADVVSSLIILKQKNEQSIKTKFLSLNINPSEISEIEIENLTNEILFSNNSKLFNLEEYSTEEVHGFINLGISLEALFDDVKWIMDIKEKLICMNSVFESSRGVRTGADNIFITDKKMVDSEYMFPILKNLTTVDEYTIKTVKNYYFYTKDSIDEMKSKGYVDTLEYIKSIEPIQVSQKRKIKKEEKWYMADQKPQYADLTTSINPEKRFFWAKFEEPTVVNQRVTAFRLKEIYKEKIDIIHALINTNISLFLLMSSGFGRGLGVTDLTKDGIYQSFFLNPDNLNNQAVKNILLSWEKIKNKKIMSIDEQLKDKEWIVFNEIVCKEFNIDSKIQKLVIQNINSLLNRRLSVKNK